VSLWHFFTTTNAQTVQSIVDDFEKANPAVKVIVHAGQDDQKIRKAITAGNSVDVALSGSSDIVGSFCSSGTFRDLGPYLKRDKVDLGQLDPTVLSYTIYKGVRCTLPILTDTYGLYYNKDRFAAAGYTAPPKTMAEFEAMAKKMTTFNADGSIKTLGFNPLMGWYQNAAAHFAALTGAKWLKADGTSNVGSDPAWAEIFKWQKDFVDSIGYNKLITFTAGLGQQSSPDNAFFVGKVAMTMDGEYRIVHINELAPKTNYGTAPFPTLADHTNLYGGSYTTGNIGGVAKSSQQPELAWALLKYLALDTGALVKLANGTQNVPTTKASLNSPDLKVSKPLRTFIDIAESGKTVTTPPNALGPAYQQFVNEYWEKYQAGNGGDLKSGLKGVDKSIDDALALATGP